MGMLQARGYTLLRCAALWSALLAVACTRQVEYGPPSQKILPSGIDPPLVHPLIQLADHDADAFILKDIARGNVGGQFRWTGAQPRVKLWPDERKGRELYLFFGIIPSIFKETGPVTIGIVVNGRKLASPKFAMAGDYAYSQPLPDDLLATAAPVIVELDISPVYVAPPYGEKLGICLQTVGLRRRHEQ